MSQTRLNNVSAAQSEKLSPRLLKSPPTMTSKQPAVFLTRYVWSRNRPVCSLRESASSSTKLPPSEKIRSGKPEGAQPPQRSSSVSMRPPGSPVWPPRSMRWSRHWDTPSAPLTVTPKYQRTACPEMWLPVSVSTTVQMPTLLQNQVMPPSAHVTGVCPVEMLSEGSIEASAASVKLSASSPRVPVTADSVPTTCAKPPAFGNTSKNFVGNLRSRTGSSRAARRSSTAPRQPQQSMRWPPRSVKWPNRWNKFSSVSRFSSESSARSTDSSVPLDTRSAERPLTPISRMSPRLQRKPPQPPVLERLPVKASMSKDVESSLESSPVSSPLSERSSQWTDSLETSGMSPVGSTQSSSASVWSPSAPTRSPPVLTEELTSGALQTKERGKSEGKPSAQKCAVRSTTSSVSSSQTPEKPCNLLLKSTGQSIKARKLQGQSSLRTAVSSSVKRLQRKRSEFSKPAADDTSSSLESTTRSLSPTSPPPSTRLLKTEIKLVRSATWPTELILKPKSTHLSSEHLMTKESEPESPLTSNRMLSEPLRSSSSASAISVLKKSPVSWERKRASHVPLFSSEAVPSVSEHRFTHLCGSSTASKNAPVLHKPPEMMERSPRNSPKCFSTLENARTSVTSQTLQKYSSTVPSSLTVPPSSSATSPSGRFVRMATAPIPVPPVSTKELKGPIENAGTLLVWPTKSSPTLRAPVLTASTAVQGGSWSYRRSSQRYQVWPQTESIPVNTLPTPSVSSESLRRSQATFSAGTAMLDTTPAYPGVRPADFSQSSAESSKSWPSRETPINVSSCSPGHLISSVTQLSVSEEPPVSQKPEQNAPRMLRKSSPVPPSLPSGMVPLTESSSMRYLKSNTRAMMAPTLSTKFQSRSAFFESSSDMHLAHSSVTPSWPLLPGTPETPSMTPLGQCDSYWIEARSCLAEQNPCGSHLAGCSAKTGSYTQTRNAAYAVSSTLLQSPEMSSQTIPLESAEMTQRSCSRQSSLCLTPHSPSFHPSSFLTATTNVIVHTTANFPSLYSSSPSVSCRVTQRQASAWMPGNLGKSVTSQASMISTSNVRHVPFTPSVPFVPTGSATARPVASASTKVTDGSEVVTGVSQTAAQLVTPRIWTPVLEAPPTSSERKSLPPRSEINVMWTSHSCSKHAISSAYTYSQPGTHVSDSFPVSKVPSTCTSGRMLAPPWSASTSAFPSITSTVTESRLPMFNWMSTGPFWMPGHLASSPSSSTTTHLITTPTPAVTRSSQTWASSAAQLSTVVPSSKGPVVSAVVQTPIPQSESSISWSRSRPAAWSSASSVSTTGVSGFQMEPSSGLVRLPIKYVKRQPLPRTGDIESASSSTS